jgi:ribosomal protein S12 methylthiotransferase
MTPAAPEARPRPKVGFVSLGCPKNLVDSEVMMGLLDRAGAEMTPNAETADILVVNTCSFIDKAKQESVDAILEMAQLKTAGSARKLIVAGCLVERYRDEIQKNIPEVDAVVGTGELEKILSAAGLDTPAPAPTGMSPFTILASNSNADVRPDARALPGRTKTSLHLPASARKVIAVRCRGDSPEPNGTGPKHSCHSISTTTPHHG